VPKIIYTISGEVIYMNESELAKILQDLGYDMNVSAFSSSVDVSQIATQEDIKSLKESIAKINKILADSVMSLATMTVDNFDVKAGNIPEESIQAVFDYTEVVKIISEVLFLLKTVDSGDLRYQVNLKRKAFYKEHETERKSKNNMM
jgi:hypothetical protein